MKAVNFTQTGYGQWKATTNHYGKTISIHFTDAPTYDLISSKERGYTKALNLLRYRIIQANQ